MANVGLPDPLPHDVKVSVALTTYNHESFIAQALDSVLAQETTFPYEIVIGDDRSTDRTRGIVLEYAHRHPDRIRLILPDANLGNRGNTLFLRILDACRGEYVALLDGDDYWTSTGKLQRQADVLDQRRDCAICFHDAAQLFDDGTPGPWHGWGYMAPGARETTNLADLLPRNYMATCGVMYRREFLRDIPAGYEQVFLPDWALHLLAARNGNIAFLNEVMGVHRMHVRSVWSTRDPLFQVRGEIAFLEFIRSHLDASCAAPIASQVVLRYTKGAELLFRQGNPAEARTFIHQALRRWRPGLRPPLGYLAGLAARVWFAAARARVTGGV